MRQMETDNVLKDLYESNINLHENKLFLKPSMVKNYLQKRGIPDSELDINLMQYYNEWQNTFRGYSNLHTYYGINNSLCIKNGDVSSDCICMSISLDNRHIEQGVKLIFDFLARQNILHRAAIKDKIRTDSIVIKLAKKEDAINLQNFINSSRYLQEGMLPTNSFYPDNNRVGYTYNGSTSYDTAVSYVIANYINRMYELGVELKGINTFSFCQYINDFLQNKNNISEIPNINGNMEKAQDASNILELLRHSLESSNIDDYFKFYEWVKKRKKVKSNVSNDKKVESNVPEDKEELLKEYILTTMKKYPKGFDGNDQERSGLDFIILFINGNFNGVTRDNNLRERVRKNLTVSDIANILINNHIPGANLNQKLNIYVKMTMLNEMIRCSNIKFPNQGLDAVNKFIETGSWQYITQSIDNARNLAKTLGPEGINNLFRSVGVPNIYRYAEEFLEGKKQNNYHRN